MEQNQRSYGFHELYELNESSPRQLAAPLPTSPDGVFENCPSAGCISRVILSDREESALLICARSFPRPFPKQSSGSWHTES
jgi:hypothetical protein